MDAIDICSVGIPDRRGTRVGRRVSHSRVYKRPRRQGDCQALETKRLDARGVCSNPNNPTTNRLSRRFSRDRGGERWLLLVAFCRPCTWFESRRQIRQHRDRTASPRSTNILAQRSARECPGIGRRYQFHVRDRTDVRHRPTSVCQLCLHGVSLFHRSIYPCHRHSLCLARSKRTCLPRNCSVWSRKSRR